jgi:hypothetical protein
MLSIDKTTADSDLFVDLNQEYAQTISGGNTERFTVYNQTKDPIVRIPYKVDGVETNRPYGDSVWTTGKGGIITFDYDFGRSGTQQRTYNLADGRNYAFRPDTRTAYTGDIDLFDIT